MARPHFELLHIADPYISRAPTKEISKANEQSRRMLAAMSEGYR